MIGLQSGLIAVHNVPVEVRDDDCQRRRIEDGLESGGTLAKRLFNDLALGDVYHHGAAFQESPLGIPDGIDGQANPDGRPVGSLHLQLLIGYRLTNPKSFKNL